jgi:hypothetical protein
VLIGGSSRLTFATLIPMRRSAAHAQHVGQMQDRGGRSVLLVIRCTRELLEGVDALAPAEVSSTTVLGDWFAQQVTVGDQPYLLLVSRLSLVPIVMPGTDVAHIESDFARTLEQLLLRLDIAPEEVSSEVDKCRDIVFTAGDSSSIRASANDFARRMQRYMPEWTQTDSVEVSLLLGDEPLRRLGFALPAEVTRRLFE